MSVHDTIRREAERAAPDEACGLLFWCDNQAGVLIDRIQPTSNVACDRATRFEIDPARLIAAYRAARGGGPAIAGCYHSHPNGPAWPSATDAASADPGIAFWLIWSVPERRALLWQVCEATAPRRFVPVAFHLA